MRSHEIDYRIFGEEIQCVEVELDPQETTIAESGSFMMMDDAINKKKQAALYIILGDLHVLFLS